MTIENRRQKGNYFGGLIRSFSNPVQSQTSDYTINPPWARQVRSFKEVPDIYRNFFNLLAPDNVDPFPYTVIIPTINSHHNRQNETMVCLTGNYIYLVENIDGKPIITCYSLSGICFIESGMILLHSWITLCGFDKKGGLRVSTLNFNSVTDHIMTPLIDWMRSSSAAGRVFLEPADPSILNFLDGINIKFYNYAKRCLRLGENVIQAIFQPAIRVGLLRWFGISFSKLISPSHLTILTNTELINLRDDKDQCWLNSSPHGGIWTYIPLHNIVSVSLVSSTYNITTLTIHLPEGQHLDYSFESNMMGDLELLANRVLEHAVQV